MTIIGKRRVCALPGCTNGVRQTFCCAQHGDQFRQRFGPGGLHSYRFCRYLAKRKKEMCEAWKRGNANS